MSYAFTQLSASQQRVTAIETELEALNTQLEEGKKKQQSLSDALATARQAMELYQRTSQQDVRDS